MAIDVTTAKRLRYDGVETYLNAELTPGVTTISFKTALTADGGAPIADIVPNASPNEASSEYLALSLLDANYRLAEIVYLTSYTSGGLTGTVERGAEGTLPNKTHPVNNKVVHAATVVDYVLVQDHDTATNAHPEILSQANAYTDGKLADHINAADPHSQYAKKAGDTFTGDVTFNTNVTLKGITTIPAGGQLIVDGELRINGKFYLNGREMLASNTPPPSPSANTIYIQTFG